MTKNAFWSFRKSSQKPWAVVGGVQLTPELFRTRSKFPWTFETALTMGSAITRSITRMRNRLAIRTPIVAPTGRSFWKKMKGIKNATIDRAITPIGGSHRELLVLRGVKGNTGS